MANKNDNSLLIDTDLGGDVDDVGALALLNVFHNQKEVHIMGMTHSTSLKDGPGCMDVINKYFGNQFPIGVYKGPDFLSGPQYNKFAGIVANRFEPRIHGREDLPEAVSLLREKLIIAEDHSVILVGIGHLNVLSELLNSCGDDCSSLSGKELIKQKVKKCVLMAGMFNNGNKIHYHDEYYQYEYNVEMDVGSAKNFIEYVPVPIVFVDFLSGYHVFTMGPLLEQKDFTNPITVAYEVYCGKARESWDLISVYVAVRGCDDLFTMSPRGTVTVSENGKTSFERDSSGLHQYIRLKKNEKEVERRLNRIMMDYLEKKGDEV